MGLNSFNPCMSEGKWGTKNGGNEIVAGLLFRVSKTKPNEF
jgi:hypothetical protein